LLKLFPAQFSGPQLAPEIKERFNLFQQSFPDLRRRRATLLDRLEFTLQMCPT